MLNNNALSPRGLLPNTTFYGALFIEWLALLTVSLCSQVTTLYYIALSIGHGVGHGIK